MATNTNIRSQMARKLAESSKDLKQRRKINAVRKSALGSYSGKFIPAAEKAKIQQAEDEGYLGIFGKDVDRMIQQSGGEKKAQQALGVLSFLNPRGGGAGSMRQLMTGIGKGGDQYIKDFVGKHNLGYGDFGGRTDLSDIEAAQQKASQRFKSGATDPSIFLKESGADMIAGGRASHTAGLESARAKRRIGKPTFSEYQKTNPDAFKPGGQTEVSTFGGAAGRPTQGLSSTTGGTVTGGRGVERTQRARPVQGTSASGVPTVSVQQPQQPQAASAVAQPRQDLRGTATAEDIAARNARSDMLAAQQQAAGSQLGSAVGGAASQAARQTATGRPTTTGDAARVNIMGNVKRGSKELSGINDNIRNIINNVGSVEGVSNNPEIQAGLGRQADLLNKGLQDSIDLLSQTSELEGENLLSKADRIAETTSAVTQLYDQGITDLRNIQKELANAALQSAQVGADAAGFKREQSARNLENNKEEAKRGFERAVREQEQTNIDNRVRTETFAGLTGGFGSSAQLEGLTRTIQSGQSALGDLASAYGRNTLEFESRGRDIETQYLQDIREINATKDGSLAKIKGDAVRDINAIRNNKALNEKDKLAMINAAQDKYVNSQQAVINATSEAVLKTNSQVAGLVGNALQDEYKREQDKVQNAFKQQQIGIQAAGLQLQREKFAADKAAAAAAARKAQTDFELRDKDTDMLSGSMKVNKIVGDIKDLLSREGFQAFGKDRAVMEQLGGQLTFAIKDAQELGAITAADQDLIDAVMPQVTGLLLDASKFEALGGAEGALTSLSEMERVTKRSSDDLITRVDLEKPGFAESKLADFYRTGILPKDIREEAEVRKDFPTTTEEIEHQSPASVFF